MSEIAGRDAAVPRAALPLWITKLLDRIAAACMAIAGIQLVTLITIFGWLVFGRYVLNDTPTWVEQMSLLLVVWITFLGAAAGVWRGSHLAVDFIRDALPNGLGRFLHLSALALMVMFGAFMAWQGYKLAAGTWSRAVPMLGVAEGWRAVPMAICGVLTIVFSAAQFIIQARGGQAAVPTADVTSEG